MTPCRRLFDCGCKCHSPSGPLWVRGISLAPHSPASALRLLPHDSSILVHPYRCGHGLHARFLRQQANLGWTQKSCDPTGRLFGRFVMSTTKSGEMGKIANVLSRLSDTIWR